MSYLNSNFVYSDSLSHFLTSAKDTRECVRCESSINEKSLYAIVAQASEHRLSGGMLCARCVSSFRRWITQGDPDDDGSTREKKNED